jgi:hypothetical protein
MVSHTQQFERIRKRKQTTNGKRNKRERRRLGTPVFAVHPEGYDAKAADAKKPEAPKAAAAPKSKIKKSSSK